jgi:hypothetical protein
LERSSLEAQGEMDFKEAGHGKRSWSQVTKVPYEQRSVIIIINIITKRVNATSLLL